MQNETRNRNSNNNQLRAVVISHKSPTDRSSIGNVKNIEQNYTVHGIPVSISRKTQNCSHNSYGVDHGQYLTSRKIKRLSNSRQLDPKKIKSNPKKLKKSQRSSSRSKKKRQDHPSSSNQDQNRFNINRKYGKIDQEYYSNAGTYQIDPHYAKPYPKQVKKIVSTEILRTYDHLKTPKSKNKVQEQQLNKLNLDTVKGVISFDGKLIKVKPNPTTTRTHQKTQQFFSQYLSNDYTSPYKKQISNSKQRKSKNRSFKNRRNINNMKKSKKKLQKQIRPKKQVKSHSNDKKNSSSHRKKKVKNTITTHQINPFQVQDNKFHIQKIKSKQIRQYDNHKYQGISKGHSSLIDFQQLKKQLIYQKQRLQGKNISQYAKFIYSAKLSQIRKKQSSQVQLYQSKNMHNQEYDIRAKCVNFISLIVGSLAYKENIFAITVSLFDHYYACLFLSQKTDNAKSTISRFKNSDDMKITSLASLILALKLQNPQQASLFFNHLTVVCQKQKKHKYYELPATNQLIEKIDKNNQVGEIESTPAEQKPDKTYQKNRRRSKSRHTAYSTSKNKEKNSKKAELEKRRRNYNQKKAQIKEIKLKSLFKIINQEIEGLISKQDILNRQKQIYWKLNKKIYKKTYVYWVDLLTASWDQYILTNNSQDSLQKSITCKPNYLKTNNLTVQQTGQILLFRNQDFPKKIWQLIQILQSCCYYPQHFYTYQPALLVLSIMYMLVRINLEFDASLALQSRNSKNHNEQILKIFQNYRKMLSKSSNILFVDNVNVNLLFGQYLMKLELEMGDILSCCQFVSQCFYPSPLCFDKEQFQRSFINHDHFQVKINEGYSHYDDRLSYHAYNPQIYTFFSHTILR